MATSEKKGKKDQKALRRRRRIMEAQEITEKWDSAQLLRFLCFLVFGFLVVLVCFVGRAPVGPKLLLNQMSKTRIVADFPFSYYSDIRTQQLAEERRQMVPPIYKVDKTIGDVFSSKILKLNEELNELQKSLVDLSSKERAQRIKNFTREFSIENNINLNKENITVILDKTSAKERDYLFSEGLLAFKEITRVGIYNPAQLPFALDGDASGAFSNIEIDGYGGNSIAKNEEEALRQLRLNLSSLDVKADLSKALFHVLKNGIAHNILYDARKSEARVKDAVAYIEPVQVYVSRGQTIVEPDTVVTEEEYEMLTAYLKKSLEQDGPSYMFSSYFAGKVAITFIILMIAGFYIWMNQPALVSSRSDMLLLATLLILGLALIRSILYIEESSIFGRSVSFLTVLPYIVPWTIGPILAAVLLGGSMAVLLAVLMGAFNVLMQGADIHWFFVYLLSGLVAVYFSLNIRVRAKLVKASFMGSLVFAFCSTIISLFAQIDFDVVTRQLLISLMTGIVSGVIAIGCLPVFENLFNKTTDIKLLELTDFNHPLLRRLQLEAPGTYHHSLMVATLAERAAVEIKANGLACRACALFHDIGKLVKPEYFVENQHGGINPHNERNPSMSALIIKSHVKEGLEMAKEARLPRIILDVILQHHGTTLIQYFYTKAVRQKRHSQDPFSIDVDTDVSDVDESIFRYDGPMPQFKESAIIFFADSLEAASRSLKKVTPQSVQELISTIFQERIDDCQLDDSPLTMAEISQIKKSFGFTLLNMLHTRVEYPKDKK